MASAPTIEAAASYTLAEFQRRTGLGEAAIRAARHNGLKIRYVGSRAIVLGSDFLAFLQGCPTVPPSVAKNQAYLESGEE